MQIGGLTLFRRMHGNGKPSKSYLIGAFHWPSSITWRWSFVRSPYYPRPGRQGFSVIRTHGGECFKACFNAPFVGLFSFTTQPNMFRKVAPTPSTGVEGGDL